MQHSPDTERQVRISEGLAPGPLIELLSKDVCNQDAKLAGGRDVLAADYHGDGFRVIFVLRHIIADAGGIVPTKNITDGGYTPGEVGVVARVVSHQARPIPPMV